MFAYALIHSNPPEVVFAENIEVLSEILARDLVAQQPGAEFGPDERTNIRRALLDRRWADALLAWIQHTGIHVDVFESADVRNASGLGEDSYHLDIQMTPLFRDPNGG